MVGKLRSFTRAHLADGADWWTRGGDVILGSFFAGFITASLLSIVSAASSLDLPVINNATAIGVAVGLAALVRYCIATFVAFAYPARLTEIHFTDLSQRRTSLEVTAIVSRAGVALLSFAAVLGWHWIIFVMAALYGADALAQHLLGAKQYRFKASMLVPNNISKLFLIKVLSVIGANAVHACVHSSYWQISSDLTIVLVLALMFDALSASGTRPIESSWRTRLGGAGIATATIAQLLGMLVT